MISDNYAYIKNHIIEICKGIGRDPDEVTLIAVSKTKPVDALSEAFDAGARDFGENKVQELTEKMDFFANARINWHMIGHLQKNKVKYIIGRVSMIHSVDSIELLQKIDSISKDRQVITDVLIEVNVGDEESKFGLKLDEVEDFISSASELSNIRIRGLMTVAPYVENPEDNRILFRSLKLMLDKLKKKAQNNAPCDVLSMGMTNDYEIAIEEGSTMVRVGTAIFGERNYNI